MGLPAKLARGTVHTGDRLQGEIQARIRAIVDLLRRLAFANGRIVSVKLTGGADTIVSHKLGAPAAFIIVRSNYDGSGSGTQIAEAQTSSQTKLDPNNQLAIRATNSCTVDLWFYQRASQQIPPGKTQSP